MIGNKLRELRKKNNLTQVEIAKKLRVTQPLIQRWESGNKIPNLETLKKFSTIFNVSLDTLAFDGKDLTNLKEKDKTFISKLKDFENLTDDDKQTVANLIASLAKKTA